MWWCVALFVRPYKYVISLTFSRYVYSCGLGHVMAMLLCSTLFHAIFYINAGLLNSGWKHKIFFQRAVVKHRCNCSTRRTPGSRPSKPRTWRTRNCVCAVPSGTLGPATWMTVETWSLARVTIRFSVSQIIVVYTVSDWHRFIVCWYKMVGDHTYADPVLITHRCNACCVVDDAMRFIVGTFCCPPTER